MINVILPTRNGSVCGSSSSLNAKAGFVQVFENRIQELFKNFSRKKYNIQEFMNVVQKVKFHAKIDKLTTENRRL